MNNFLNTDNSEVLRFLGAEIWPTLKWILLAVVAGVGTVFGYQRNRLNKVEDRNDQLQLDILEIRKELLEINLQKESLKLQLAALEENTRRIAKTEKLTINLPQKEGNNES